MLKKKKSERKNITQILHELPLKIRVHEIKL